MYNSNISLHPMAERNAPWLIPQDESRESSLYLLEQEEKEYNARLQSIATLSAPNPIGSSSTSSNHMNTNSKKNSSSLNNSGSGANANANANNLSPNPAAYGGGSSSSGGGSGTHHHYHSRSGSHGGSGSSGRRSSSIRTYTPRASPHTPQHHHHHHVPVSSSARTMTTSPRSTRPSRVQRHSSTNSGIRHVRSHEESFVTEFSTEDDLGEE